MVDLCVKLMIYRKVNIVPVCIPVKEADKIECLHCSYSNIPYSMLNTGFPVVHCSGLALLLLTFGFNVLFVDYPDAV